MTKNQVGIGAIVALVLTAAIGVAVGQRQGRADIEDSLASTQEEAEALRQKLQKTEADLAALVRTAKMPQIKTAPAAPAPAPLVVAAVSDEELQAKDEEIAALKEQVAQAEQGRRQPDTPEDRQARFEQWQRENPEEYQRMQAEREQRRQDLAKRTTDRIEFIASIPTEGLSEEYLQNHNALLEKMQFFNDAMAQLATNPDEETTDQLRRGLRENMQDTREMLQMEREVLMSDMLAGLGADGQQAAEAIDYMNYVDEMTSIGGFFGGRGGRDGGGRGGR